MQNNNHIAWHRNLTAHRRLEVHSTLYCRSWWRIYPHQRTKEMPMRTPALRKMHPSFLLVLVTSVCGFQQPTTNRVIMRTQPRNDLSCSSSSVATPLYRLYTTTNKCSYRAREGLAVVADNTSSANNNETGFHLQGDGRRRRFL